MIDSVNINDELELVGFEGKMIKDCARYSPIVRRKQDNFIFKFSSYKKQKQYYRLYSLDEINHSPAKEIITLLDQPIEINPGEMVLYLSDNFLHAVNKEMSPIIRSKPISDGKIYLMNEGDISEILDDYAEFLMNKATEEIILFFGNSSQNHHKNAVKYINLARQAAISKELRPNILLRYGVITKYSLTPEKLENIFRLRIKNEFSVWTWESFQQKVDSLAKALYNQALFRTGRTVDGNRINNIDSRVVDTFAESRQPHKLLNVDINELLSLLIGLPDSERLEKCVNIAEKIRGIYPVNPEQIEEIGKEILSSDFIRLSQTKLQIVAGEPTFHFLISSPRFSSVVKVIKNSDPNTGPLLSTMKYKSATEELIQNDIKPGAISKYVLDHSGLAKKAVS